MQEFAGKVAVVTGAARGIGRAVAERFAREGMRVVLADYDPATLDRAVQELRQQDLDVLGVRTDLCQLGSVQGLARRALEAYGKIHVVYNNASADSYNATPFWEAADRDWLWTFGVNFWGVVHGARAFLPILLSQDEEAHMVNTASTTGLVCTGEANGTAKHAVVALTESMHGQLAQRETKVSLSVLCTEVARARLRGDARAAPTAEPPRVAELVMQAIKNREFYVFTTPQPWNVVEITN